MSVGSPTAGTWFSSQWRPDNEFETDRGLFALRWSFIRSLLRIERLCRNSILFRALRTRSIRLGKQRRRARQSSIWVATADLPRSAGHSFYERLNRVLDEAGFDAFVEEQRLGRSGTLARIRLRAAVRRWPDTARLGAADRVQAPSTGRPATAAHAATGRADAANHGHAPGARAPRRRRPRARSAPRPAAT